MEEIFQKTSRKTWYRWSFYINIVLFFLVGFFIYLLVKDSIAVGADVAGSHWLYVARDVAFLTIALSLIFFQFFRNLLIIMRRSL
ncbi:MAG: hypothetical protein V5A64_03260 [Candidatus Thermoplasmatota archaeon]